LIERKDPQSPSSLHLNHQPSTFFLCVLCALCGKKLFTHPFMIPSLTTATLPQLLAEISRRFDALPEIPAWAATVVAEVARYYELDPAQLRSGDQQARLTKPRHLAIALLANFHPERTRSEVTAIFGLKHHMFRHALMKTDAHAARCPVFQREVAEILKTLRAPQTGMATAAPRRRVPALQTENPA
jgi:hypothetical protein